MKLFASKKRPSIVPGLQYIHYPSAPCGASTADPVMLEAFVAEDLVSLQIVACSSEVCVRWLLVLGSSWHFLKPLLFASLTMRRARRGNTRELVLKIH